VNLFYSDVFVLPLPSHHRFPRGKYARLRDRLLGSGEFGSDDLGVPPGVTDGEIRRVHCPEYLRRVACGRAFGRSSRRRSGFHGRSRWWSARAAPAARRSPQLARRSHAAGPPTSPAARTMRSEIAAKASASSMTPRSPRARCRPRRDSRESPSSIATCTRATAPRRSSPGTIRSSRSPSTAHANFPFAKESSDLDVELADGTGADEYLWHLERGARRDLERSRPQPLAFYLAGADPY